MVFPVVMYGCESWTIKKLSAKEWMLLNCGVGEDLDCKEIQPVHSEGDQPWDFFGRNDAKAEFQYLATSCEKLTHCKRLMLGGIGGRRRRG